MEIYVCLCLASWGDLLFANRQSLVVLTWCMCFVKAWLVARMQSTKATRIYGQQACLEEQRWHGACLSDLTCYRQEGGSGTGHASDTSEEPSIGLNEQITALTFQQSACTHLRAMRTVQHSARGCTCSCRQAPTSARTQHADMCLTSSLFRCSRVFEPSTFCLQNAVTKRTCQRLINVAKPTNPQTGTRTDLSSCASKWTECLAWGWEDRNWDQIWTAHTIWLAMLTRTAQTRNCEQLGHPQDRGQAARTSHLPAKRASLKSNPFASRGQAARAIHLPAAQPSMRIWVAKELLRAWHPDKNPSNADCAA